MVTKIYGPTISLIARPEFIQPPHIDVAWVGPGTGGERLGEFAGRLCYMSHKNPAQRTTAEYIENIKKQAHGSVFEHANYTYLIEGVSRSLTHEFVRHRAGWAYSQLSQRFVDESDCEFVVPPAIIGHARLEATWAGQMYQAQLAYALLSDELFELYADEPDKTLRRKRAREAARSVLPNATETKIVVTGNVRAWRTMLELRASEHADLEIRRLATLLVFDLQRVAPAYFNDFELADGPDGRAVATTPYHKI